MNKEQIANFVKALDRDELEAADVIYTGMNEHRRLDALSAAVPVQAVYFQDWRKERNRLEHRAD